MTAKNQNFEMFCGNTRNIPIPVYEDGALKDITGATAIWTLSKTNKSDADVTKETGAGITLTDAANGLLTITLDPADTEDLCPGDYYHECEVTDSAGNVVTVATGRARLLPSVA